MTAELQEALETTNDGGSRFAAVKELETRAAELRTQLADLNRRAANRARAGDGDAATPPARP